MKKLLLITLSLCLASLCQAEKVQFTLSGTTHPEATEVEIINLNTQRPIGKAQVKEGHFTYSNTLANDTYLMIRERSHRLSNLIITDGPAITLDMLQDQASGTPLNAQLYETAHRLGRLNNDINQNQQLARNAQTADSAAYWRQRVSEARLHYINTLRETIEANKDNVLPAYFIVQSIYHLPFPQLVALSQRKEAFARHPMMKQVQYYIEKEQPHQSLVGKTYTEVSVKGGDGKRHALSEYVGKGNKYLLVDFWASWCGPCMGEMPVLKQAYEQYHAQGFEILGISLDNDRSKWLHAVSNKGMAWPQLSDLEGWNSSAAQIYGVTSIPWNFLCDSQGTILAVGLRGDDLLEKLTELFK